MHPGRPSASLPVVVLLAERLRARAPVGSAKEHGHARARAHLPAQRQGSAQPQLGKAGEEARARECRVWEEREIRAYMRRVRERHGDRVKGRRGWEVLGWGCEAEAARRGKGGLVVVSIESTGRDRTGACLTAAGVGQMRKWVRHSSRTCETRAWKAAEREKAGVVVYGEASVRSWASACMGWPTEAGARVGEEDGT